MDGIGSVEAEQGLELPRVAGEAQPVVAHGLALADRRAGFQGEQGGQDEALEFEAVVDERGELRA